MPLKIHFRFKPSRSLLHYQQQARVLSSFTASKLNYYGIAGLLLSCLLSQNSSAANNIDGNWTINRSFDRQECTFPIPTQSTIKDDQINVVIASSANGQVTVSAGDTQLTGTLSGNTLTLPWSFSAASTTITSLITLQFNNGSLTGIETTTIPFIQNISCTNYQTLTGKQTAATNTSPNPNLSLQPARLIASGSFVEPNNSPAQATPILVNDQPLYQVFSSAADEDWFEFYAKKGQHYTINIPNNAVGKAIHPAFGLYDANGTLLVDKLNAGATGQGEQLNWTATASGLFRVRVVNKPLLAKIQSDSAANDYTYQIRIFLTDAPQQGIVKGFVLNSCNGEGLNEAEVSSFLNNSVTDSTLSYKTGEYSLPLNPNQYLIKSLLSDFQAGATPVLVTQEAIAEAQLNLLPIANCSPIKQTNNNPDLKAQQATVSYDEQLGVLTVRDVLVNGDVFYAELNRVNDTQLRLSHYFSIPGIIHATPNTYNVSTLIATLPKVFAFNKNWQVELKFRGNNLFSIESAVEK